MFWKISFLFLCLLPFLVMEYKLLKNLTIYYTKTTIANKSMVWMWCCCGPQWLNIISFAQFSEISWMWHLIENFIIFCNVYLEELLVPVCPQMRVLRNTGTVAFHGEESIKCALVILDHPSAFLATKQMQSCDRDWIGFNI